MARGRSAYLIATLFLVRVMALGYLLVIESMFKLAVLTTTVCNNIWSQLSPDLAINIRLFLRLTTGKAMITLFLFLLHKCKLILLFLLVVGNCRVSSQLFTWRSTPILAEI